MVTLADFSIQVTQAAQVHLPKRLHSCTIRAIKLFGVFVVMPIVPDRAVRRSPKGYHLGGLSGEPY